MGIGRGAWTAARRLALAAVVLLGAAALAYDLPLACRDAVGGAGVVRLCEPAGLTDLRVLLFAGVVALLALGEVSELGVGGAFTLKRDVAQARTAAADAQREVAELRLSLVTGADARASASSHTHVHIGDRVMRTGEAATSAGARRGEDEALAPGAMAMTAFVAAFAGLVTLLPEWAQDAGLAGFDARAEGTLRDHVCWNLSPGEVEHLRGLLLDAERWKAVQVHLADDRWVVSTAVQGDGGQLLGVLAVVTRPPGPRREAGAPDAAADLEALTSAVGTVAAAYSRLWRDVLRAAAP